MKILGIIVARGNSKRLPRKNVKDFLGKPLVEWSIEVGLKSGVFDKFILITDDQEIAEIGKKAGVEVPFLEPVELANDNAKIFDVIKYAIDWLKDNQNYEAPWFILLEPSSPGRQVFHIKEVVEIISGENNFDSLVGISEMSHRFIPLKALTKHADKSVTNYKGDLIRNLIHKSQEAPKSYFINSSIYAFKTKNLFEKNCSLWGDKVYGYEMDNKYAMDIDTSEDWLIAEIKMKKIIEEK